MALSLLFSGQFDIPYSILFVQVTLSRKLLRIYYVRRLSGSYRMNVRTLQKMLGVHRKMLSVISNINYSILYFFKLLYKDCRFTMVLAQKH